MKTSFMKLTGLIRRAMLALGTGLGLAVATAAPVLAATEDPFGLEGAGGINVTQGNLLDQVIGIINTVLGWLVLLATVFLIYAGVKLIASLGKPEALEEAKKIMIYAVAGFLVITLSWAIAKFISASVQSGGDVQRGSELQRQQFTPTQVR